MRFKNILQTTEAHYSGMIERHGSSFKGVDWGSSVGQKIRFAELLKFIDLQTVNRITDYGCGYGALLDQLDEMGYRGEYQGFDISAAMVNQSKTLHKSKGSRVVFLTDPSNLYVSDYTLASGIFNVRLKTPEEEWIDYVLDTLGKIAKLSINGFVFNMLNSDTPHQDREDDLFYADPDYIADYCQTTFSGNVTVSQDYPLPDFTVFVKLDS